VYIVVFGDKSAGIVRRSWVEYFFGEFSQVSISYFCTLPSLLLTILRGIEFERLPTELGWTKHEDEITASDLNNMSQRVINATESSDEEKHSLLRRRDFHAGHTARGHHH
jgi:hypothetical protein